MTRDETKQILAVIEATYPNFKPADKKSTVDAWFFFLEEYGFKEIAIALKTYVRTSGKGFPPSVDQLIAMTRKPQELMQMSEGEAWDLVSKAIRNSSYHAEEEFEKLPAEIQKAVGSPSQLRSWAMTDLKTIETVIASNFQRTFRSVQARVAQIDMMPAEVRNRLESLQQMALEEKT